MSDKIKYATKTITIPEDVLNEFLTLRDKLKSVGFNVSLSTILASSLKDYNELLQSIYKDIKSGKHSKNKKVLSYHIVGEIEDESK